jgi:hypothetical protein
MPSQWLRPFDQRQRGRLALVGDGAERNARKLTPRIDLAQTPIQPAPSRSVIRPAKFSRRPSASVDRGPPNSQPVLPLQAMSGQGLAFDIPD